MSNYIDMTTIPLDEVKYKDKFYSFILGDSHKLNISFKFYNQYRLEISDYLTSRYYTQ